MKLKRTPLYKTCLENGCRMVPFAGWEMPIQFQGLIYEHIAVREKAGLFDISHMGAVLLKGYRVKDELQKLVPSDLYRIGPGESCYTVLLNENGGIIDDLIIYELDNDEHNLENLLLIINAGSTELDIAWLKQNLDKVNIEKYNQNGVLLALQGPNAQRHLEAIFQESFEKMPRFGHRQIKSKNNNSIFISRTGYTGEDGFEILIPSADEGKSIWKDLIEDGVTPCGLGARDTLRLEAAMHLYGNDINTKTTPLEAGLGWLVHLEIPSQFVGKEALEKQAKEGTQKVLVGLKFEEKAIPRKGYKVIHQNQAIGTITSGSWSPTLQQGIALAYVPKTIAKIGNKVEIEIRGRNHSGTIVKKPFYRRGQ